MTRINDPRRRAATWGLRAGLGLLLLGLLAPAVRADEGLLNALRQDFQRNACDSVIETATLLLSDSTISGPARAEALLLQGFCHLRNGETESAVDEMLQAMDFDPSVPVPGTATESELSFFNDVKSAHTAIQDGDSSSEGDSVDVSGPDSAAAVKLSCKMHLEQPGQPVKVQVSAEGSARANNIIEVILYFRTPGAQAWQEQSLPFDGENYTGMLPAWAGGRGVEYYVSALDGAGRTAASVGTREAPRKRQFRDSALDIPDVVAAQADKRGPGWTPTDKPGKQVMPSWAQWLLIGTGGAILAGGITGLALYLTQSEPERCDTPRGTGCIRLNY